MAEQFQPLTPEQRAALIEAMLHVWAAWATARTEDPVMGMLITTTREVLRDAIMQLRHDGPKSLQS